MIWEKVLQQYIEQLEEENKMLKDSVKNEVVRFEEISKRYKFVLEENMKLTERIKEHCNWYEELWI